MIDQLNRIRELNKELDALLDANKDAFIQIGDNLKNKLEAVYSELYPIKKPYRDNNTPSWIEYSDRIYVRTEDGDVYLDFIERGRGGDNDEDLFSLKITDDLLTTEGQDAYVEKERQREILFMSERQQRAVINKEKEIQSLEEQLRKLKSGI